MCANFLKRACIFADLLKPNSTYSIIVSRGKKQWLRPYLISLYKRRIDQGPEPDRPRSVWLNWNYDSEIFAFGKRLGEEFQSDTLKVAFTNRSYVEQEKDKRSKLGLHDDDAQLHLKDNDEFQHKGEMLAKNYISAYLRHCYPLLPPDGIDALTSHLLSDETLSHVALNLGAKDLILTQEFPPSSETLSRTFKAVIGALFHDQGQERAELFVQDFVLTHLVGKTIPDIWKITNPMGLLTEILEKQQKGLPEPRLLWASGSETILATYMVGIYSNKELIGQSPNVSQVMRTSLFTGALSRTRSIRKKGSVPVQEPRSPAERQPGGHSAAGETVTIAEEMAARDALNRIFKITNSSTPLPFGRKGHTLQLKETLSELPQSSTSANAQLKLSR